MRRPKSIAPVVMLAATLMASASPAVERRLYVFAVDAASPDLLAQRAAADSAADAARDLRRIEVVGNSEAARALRRRFAVTGGFALVLVGRDGGVKLTAARPVSAADLAATIDAMPMRRDEMRTR